MKLESGEGLLGSGRTELRIGIGALNTRPRIVTLWRLSATLINKVSKHVVSMILERMIEYTEHLKSMFVLYNHFIYSMAWRACVSYLCSELHTDNPVGLKLGISMWMVYSKETMQ